MDVEVITFHVGGDAIFVFTMIASCFHDVAAQQD